MTDRERPSGLVLPDAAWETFVSRQTAMLADLQQLINYVRKQAADPQGAPVLSALTFEGVQPTFLPLTGGARTSHLMDVAGRTRVNTSVGLMLGAPVFTTIPAGGTVSPPVDLPRDWLAAQVLALLDAPTRLAAEVTTLDITLDPQADSTAASTAWRGIGNNVFGATLFSFSTANAAFKFFPRFRWRSAIAVGGDRTYTIVPAY